MAGGEAAALWLLLRADVVRELDTLTDRRRLISVNAGTMTLEKYDGSGERSDATYLCWPPQAGDDVITLHFGNADIVVGALSVPGVERDPITFPEGSGGGGSPAPDGEGTFLPDGSQVI